MHTHDVQADVTTYNAAISACEKGLQWQKALELLEQMETQVYQPNVITYSAAINACFHQSQLAISLKLLRQSQIRQVHPRFGRKKNNVNLHEFPLAVACMLVTDALTFVFFFHRHVHQA